MKEKVRKMNKLFIFDLGDVVISGGMDSTSVAQYLYLDEKKYEEEYEKYSSRLINGEISEEEFFSHLSSLFSIRIKSNPFKECYYPETNIELLPLIDKLRENGYKCVVGSNTIRSHIEKIKELKENPLSHFHDRKENGEGASSIGINYFLYSRAKQRETERYLSSFF